MEVRIWSCRNAKPLQSWEGPKKTCLELSGARNASIYWGWRVPDTFFWAKRLGGKDRNSNPIHSRIWNLGKGQATAFMLQARPVRAGASPHLESVAAVLVLREAVHDPLQVLFGLRFLLGLVGQVAANLGRRLDRLLRGFPLGLGHQIINNTVQLLQVVRHAFMTPTNNAVLVQNVSHWLAGNRPLPHDRLTGLGPIPPGAEPQAFRLDRFLGLYFLRVRIHAEQDKLSAVHPVVQLVHVRVHLPAVGTPLSPEVEEHHLAQGITELERLAVEVLALDFQGPVAHS